MIFFAWQVPNRTSSVRARGGQPRGWTWQITKVLPNKVALLVEETTMELTDRLTLAAAMASFVFVAAIILGLV